MNKNIFKETIEYSNLMQLWNIFIIIIAIVLHKMCSNTYFVCKCMIKILFCFVKQKEKKMKIRNG